MNDTDAQGLELVQQARDAIQMYEVMLERFKPQIAAILQAIADAPAGGVVVHCHAGKDRTGLVVALSLDLAGVSVEAIAEDYALSDQYLQTLYQEMLSNQPDDETRAKLAAVLTSKPESILGALGYIKLHFGSVESYLLSCGLNAVTLEKLRSRLLENSGTF
jgi:protein tyrosine/serine phosphatase